MKVTKCRNYWVSNFVKTSDVKLKFNKEFHFQKFQSIFPRIAAFQKFQKTPKAPKNIKKKFQQIPDISLSNVIFQLLVHEQKGIFASRLSLTNPNLFSCFFVIYLVLCELSFFLWGVLYELKEYKLWLLNA